MQHDDPEPDWEALRIGARYTLEDCAELKAELAIELRAARAEWDATHKPKPDATPKPKPDATPKPDTREGPPLAGLERLGHPPSGRGNYNATACGFIEKRGARLGNRPSNLEEIELAAYYAEPTHVNVCKRKHNAHWVDARTQYLWSLCEAGGG